MVEDQTPARATFLALNAGSSSIKFALYQLGETLERTLGGKIERIGKPGSKLTFQDDSRQPGEHGSVEVPPGGAATHFLLDWLGARLDFSTLTAVGHRIVYGMNHPTHARVTPALLTELRSFIAYDPVHMPAALEPIDAIAARFENLSQFACFDTVFHHDLPRVAQLLAIPRRFEALGLKRYGFHGLSYAYLLEELERLDGHKAARGRVVLAHLGSGASMAAVAGGKCLETTMGFTPTSGLPMGTRPGDLDPGVAWYLMQSPEMTPEKFGHLINHEAGLLGVSETSSDMRDLLAAEADDPRAAEAVELFCYQARKAVGALAAVLGGLDTLVFAGGIGESACFVRSRICRTLGHLGVVLDEGANARNAPVISSPAGRVKVRVMVTDEERMIATILGRLTQSIAGAGSAKAQGEAR
jgi:acetate kinase